jgi:metallo-beta-lactamase family protein
MTNSNKAIIQFFGAAGTVTGSKFLVSVFGKKILIDCGLFQGLKELRLLNWDNLPVSSGEIDAILITHGHLDHVGYLPRLVGSGFRGKIIATTPTVAIANIILRDSARIQMEDAERANLEGFSKHKPAKPLYDLKDVEQTMGYFVSEPLDKWIELYENISFRFRYNGHIIGATFIELKLGEKYFVFSGDIGRDDDELMHNPERPEQADVLFIESTYGNRIHPENAEELLIETIRNVSLSKGILLIPSFAVERTQLLMYLLWKLKERNAIPPVPVYLDSPMGDSVLGVFRNNMEWHRLSPDECDKMCENVIRVRTTDDSRRLVNDKGTKIIIAGSGMASGGRILNYFHSYIGDPRATILFVGFQAEGTRGRDLVEGAKEVKFHGKFYPVKARSVNIGGLSAHADQEGLIAWLSKLKKMPECIFAIHGEKDGAEGLKSRILETYGWNCEIPKLYSTKEIDVN